MSRILKGRKSKSWFDMNFCKDWFLLITEFPALKIGPSKSLALSKKQFNE